MTTEENLRALTHAKSDAMIPAAWENALRTTPKLQRLEPVTLELARLTHAIGFMNGFQAGCDAYSELLDAAVDAFADGDGT